MNQEISEQKTTVEPGAVATGPARVPQIPDHTLLRRIGGGSYGEVWLARNVMGTCRAVKIVYRQTFSSERPYEREFTGIKKFEPISRSHDGLVDVLHVGRNDQAGYFYYVMELADDAAGIQRSEISVQKSEEEEVSGSASDLITPSLHPSTSDTYVPKTLSKELHTRGRLPVEECLQLSLSLTAALSHLHKNGLIHRDIKPSNIIFVNGVPKLADIGLVVGTGEARSFVGTEGYIPKEDPPGTVQADIYSLGKVIYEICTGKDRQDYPELPTQMGDGHDRTDLLGLNEVIVKACESDVRKRYQSADEMHADLLRLQSGQPVKRPRAGLAAIFEMPINARRWAAALGIALLALAITLTLGRSWPKKTDGNNPGLSATDIKPAIAQPLPPNITSLPAGEVLAIAYAGKPPTPSTSAAKPQLHFDILACREGEREFRLLENGASLRSEVDGYLLVARPLTAGYLYEFKVDGLIWNRLSQNRRRSPAPGLLLLPSEWRSQSAWVCAGSVAFAPIRLRPTWASSFNECSKARFTK
jgi:hypothetical protein